MERSFAATLAVGLLLTTAITAAEPTDKYWVFIGTNTGAKSKGIYRLEFDAKTGKLADPTLAAETKNPSFLTISGDAKRLYAVGETGGDGGLVAYDLDTAAGTLKKTGETTSGGAGPCHIVVDKAGKVILAANYGGGSVCAVPVEEGGKLGKPNVVQHKGSSTNPARQKEPHAHSVNLDAANKFAVVADLGTDEVKVYNFDAAKATLSENVEGTFKTKPGAGPRHFAFHPDGKHAFVINELDSTLTSLNYDAAKGKLTEIGTVSTLPTDYKTPGNSTAEVVVHPSGKFVYGSNRGHNSIAVFAFDAEKGTLTPKGHQGKDIKTPRNFAIDPTAKWLLVGNQAGDSIVVFAINPETGELTPTGEPIAVPVPICVRFVART